MDLLTRPLVEVVEAVRRGEVSALELADAALARIAANDFGAHLHVDPEATRAQARAVDDKRARGQALGALAGVPIGLKDVLCTRDMPTTCGSRILEGYRPPYDAAAVERLRAADAVFTGKLNMDEFAMGSSSENSAFKIVQNPAAPSRVPGGSSGGSAAAVAAGLACATLGSDTGGSIRQPASLCGVVGIKPTYGRVSRFGLVAFASSLDQIGTFAGDVRGAARVLEVISGRDPRDATSIDAPVPDLVAACDRPTKGLRIGVPREYFEEGLDGEVRTSIEHALSVLEQLGHQLVPLEMPHTKYALSTYYVVATAEASSNLARFDGVRYGLRVEPKEGRVDLEAMYGATRDRGFGPEVKRRILLGTYVLSAGYYDAYYIKAQRVRTLIRRDFAQAFEKVDAIVGPASPSAAWPLGERVSDPLKMYLADVYTLPASLAGLPGLSVPARPTPGGLPVGLQVVTPALEEARLVQLAAAFEAARG